MPQNKECSVLALGSKTQATTYRLISFSLYPNLNVQVSLLDREMQQASVCSSPPIPDHPFEYTWPCDLLWPMKRSWKGCMSHPGRSIRNPWPILQAIFPCCKHSGSRGLGRDSTKLNQEDGVHSLKLNVLSTNHVQRRHR